MKKTLLYLFSLTSLIGFSQVNVSFESAEGYTLSAINTQGPVGNTWGLLNSTATNTMNTTLANVDINRAYTGTNSLKFTSNAGNWAYYAGVLSPLYTGYDNTFNVSFRFYPESSADSDYLFQVFDYIGTSLVSVADVRFDYQGTIDFNNGTTLNSNVGTYTANQWYDIVIERTPTLIILRVNGTSLASYPVYGTGTSAKYVGIRFDNYGSGFNFDDLVIQSTASSESFNSDLFSFYPNPTSSILNITNSNNLDIKNISVVDINSRVVKNETGSLTQINVSDLNAGVYFVTIEAAEGKTTKKFIKQ
jgi:Secretion system C-terminal sorting domain